MSIDWCPGIREFCRYWSSATMLHQTFATLESEFANGHDACIDAAKAVVECACRIIIDELDDPTSPKKPDKADAPVTDLVAAATRLLKLSDIRHRKFADLIKHHNSLTNSLRELRNEAGTVSHGKDGFIQTLSVHHHRSAVLAADTIVAFLHTAYLEAQLNPANSKEPYEHFELLNNLIDAHVGLSTEVDEDGVQYLYFLLPGEERLPIQIDVSRLLYTLDRDAYVEAFNAARNKAADSSITEPAQAESVAP